MTSSKGLEFDLVLILGMDEGQVPFYSSSTAAAIDEDRRKFYVSITRARDEVKIFYSGFVVKPWGDISRSGRSRFLAEIGL
jgi:DNA helicase-2/ATP-dependent DNA helicase PcrA